jgi:hypothetical protein
MPASKNTMVIPRFSVYFATSAYRMQLKNR